MNFYDIDYIRSFALHNENSKELEELSKWCRDPFTQYYLSKNFHSPESVVIRGKAFHRFRELIQEINE